MGIMTDAYFINNLIKWISEPGGFPKNSWFYTDAISVYIRKSPRYFNSEYMPCITIASVMINDIGTGQYRDFLNLIELISPVSIFIENVLQPEQNSIYLNRGYIEIPSEYQVSNFIKLNN